MQIKIWRTGFYDGQPSYIMSIIKYTEIQSINKTKNNDLSY